jgi:hypothetical protein
MKEAKNCAGGEWLRSTAKISDFFFKSVFSLLISLPISLGGEP